MAIEAAMLIPVLLLLIVGTVQLGKVGYTYFTLKKMLYAAGRAVATQQGVSYCDPANDATATAAVNSALLDSTQQPIIPNLTALQLDAECGDGNGGLTPCDTGTCDSLSIGPRPDFVRVSIPGGYVVTVRIPYINPVDITLNPTVLVPFGGVS